jgi:predicted phage baseplate assembly protein
VGAGSSPTDLHFTVDTSSGVIVFGPAVTEPDGSVRQYGAIPDRGATIRVRRYLVGGGRSGNVSRGRISVLRSSIPFVQRIENRAAAFGGVDAETLDNAKVRGPITLRTRDRAVTFEDYEQLAHDAAPEFSRVRAAELDGAGVRVLVVPAVAAGDFGQIRFEQLIPDPDVLRRITAYLDARRTIGARVVVEPPRYQGITVVARVRARPRFVPDDLRGDCLTALYNYFHPVVGGPDGDGWPFGRAIHVGDVYAVLQRLPGVAVIDDARLFAADPVTGERGQSVQRLDIDPHALVFSYEHQVLVEEG